MEPLIFQLGKKGRAAGAHLLESVGEMELPNNALRDKPPLLPEVSELDVVRHYTRLSQKNFSIDTNFYPLGSCTMKYNPKVNNETANLSGFAQHHPYTPEALSQGSLKLMFELQEYLKEISGMEHVSLQPAAGAHGELAGMLMIHAYHSAQGMQR